MQDSFWKIAVHERARASYIHNTFIMSANVFTISKESKFLQRSEKISYNTEKTTLRRLQNEIKKKNDENKTAYQMLRKIGLLVRATEEETYFEE